MTGVLIVGHGSREAGANAELEALVAAYRTARPTLDVEHAYVELAEPSLAAGLDRLARRAPSVIVVPLFLFAAGHVKNDVPLALAKARHDFAGVKFEAARALGVHPFLVDLAFERARPFLGTPAETALVIVGRGSSDPDANGDFCKLVRLVGEGRGLAWVAPAFAGIARPLIDETLELVARGRPARIVVLPYLLFAGRLLDRLGAAVTAFRARRPWIRAELTPCLGGDQRLFDVLDERIAEARGGARPLPCDTCQYRTPIGGVGDRVGGLRALLWSARHAFTHTQAMPHRHAHRPLARHVLVCCNADCADRGSLALLRALRVRADESGLAGELRITRTSCMGRCGEGPTVAVYPDGIWYRGVTAADADELMREHLVGDRLVGRLVDGIMQ